METQDNNENSALSGRDNNQNRKDDTGSTSVPMILEEERKRPSPSVLQFDNEERGGEKKTRFEDTTSTNDNVSDEQHNIQPIVYTSEEVDQKSSNNFLQQLFATLEPLPNKIEQPLQELSSSELQELESVLEFTTTEGNATESGWRNDWSGNLAYIDKEINNPLLRIKNIRQKVVRGQSATTSSGTGMRGRPKLSEKMSLLQWATTIEESGATGHKTNSIRRVLKNLLRHVCTYRYDEHQAPETPMSLNSINENNTPGSPRHQNHQYHKVPKGVVKLFSSIKFESTPLSTIEDAVRRASYDPTILKEDGWTTEKSGEAEGASGGAFRIGDRIRYDGSDAVVIAYIHDIDIGDLWKAMWVEDFVSFDLEAEELNVAKRKWDKVYNPQAQASAASAAAIRRRPSGRTEAIGSSGLLDFTVKGVEYGIVLAASYAKGSRPGVYWPARVMHASETAGNIRRISSKTQKKLDLIFLAPYWNSSDDYGPAGKAARIGPSLSENEESAFNANPLLQYETVDATDEMVKEYPYGDEEGDLDLDISRLRMSFKFTGLPKTAFRRFLDAFRLASSLREYAKSQLEIVKPKPDSLAAYRASAALFEVHPLAVQVPLFPTVILHLPFQYILSQLPSSKHKSSISAGGEVISDKEPVVQLSVIIDSMKPPQCWGKPHEATHEIVNGGLAHGSSKLRVNDSKPSGDWMQTLDDESGATTHMKILSRFISEFPSLSNLFDEYHLSPSLAGVVSSIHQLVIQLAQVKEDGLGPTFELRSQQRKSVAASWAAMKRMGEDTLYSLLNHDLPLRSSVIPEWQRASEKLYRVLIEAVNDKANGENDRQPFSTLVITDYRCNEHRTSDICLERRVRLPAALQAAKLAGAKVDGPIRLITSVPDSYIDYVEDKLLLKAHSSLYLKRMKNRCAAASSKDEVLVLTDDSDGNGGNDTRGSEGTWKASVCGVAAAIAATDMVVRGECVNAFCATRPPGHHAGRELHPMKAVSNGFCILNPAACAAIHATTPVGDGGLGLNRVCVIDFDVHHGNGTQDILCSTFDPRYLYVSLHAGGAHINGLPPSEDPSDEPYGLARNPKLSGIYPGRCGDKSPHKGVLNIPLGARVLSHAVGTALLQHVTPAVDSFSPDLIILSAGFDAHKNDPMGLGGLSAEDFGNITEVACQLASKSCSGRVLSILEGGYGVPCCLPQKNTFLPAPLAPRPVATHSPTSTSNEGSTEKATSGDNEPSVLPPDNSIKMRPQPSKLLDLGENLPQDMDDQVPYPLQVRLEKCHTEGFVECVFEHVSSLVRCNVRRNS